MSIVSDNTIARLNDIRDALTTKDSFLLTFTGNKSIFTVNFNTPLKLLPGRKYEAALQTFTTSNYQLNITEENYKFIYTYDNLYNTITFGKGAYEINAIKEEIIRVMKENKHWDEKDPPLNILINLSEIGTIIEIKKENVKIDFTKPNTFREILGFNARILSKGYNKSDNTAQITSSTLILIKCSIIEGSFHNGKENNILYAIPSYLVPVGYKINIIPPTMIYLPVNKNIIKDITFEICDDNFKLLDFKDENMGICIHIRQV